MKKSFAFSSALAAFLVFSCSSISAQQLTDKDIKTNVSPLDRPLQKILQLEPVSFQYNTSNFKHLSLQSGTRLGFMAENVQQVFPQLVSNKQVNYLFGKNTYRDASYPQVNEAALIPVLVAAIKEQQAAIEQLQQEVARLKLGK